MSYPYKIKANGNKLIVDEDGLSSRTLDFNAPVQQAVIFEALGAAYVLVEPPPGTDPIENLYCVDLKNARVEWAKAAPTSRSTSNIFTRIRLEQDRNVLAAWDWDGYRYLFNPASGEVVESSFLQIDTIVKVSVAANWEATSQV
jgi:hypothetical protein